MYSWTAFLSAKPLLGKTGPAAQAYCIKECLLDLTSQHRFLCIYYSRGEALASIISGNIHAWNASRGEAFASIMQRALLRKALS